MSILEQPHARPRSLLFDWHATLVDTMDAMYYAVDDTLPILVELGLIDRLVPTEQSRTIEDARLVKYVRENARLHPKIRSDRKISRTDIFEVLFGPDEEAKRIAHKEFDACYRNHLGLAKALEPGIPEFLQRMRALGLTIGLISNRKREYMLQEIANVDGQDWSELFDTLACGDEVTHRKPAPDLILKALQNMDIQPDTGCWYVGDSTTDVVAAKRAQVTAVFYNGAGWDQSWIDKIFPDTVSHPHKPDAVINNFPALERLVQDFLAL